MPAERGQLARWLFAVSIIIAGGPFAGRMAGADKQAAKPAPAEQAPAGPSIVGVWQSLTATIVSEDGIRTTLDGPDHCLNVTISERSFVIRIGNKLMASLSYALDVKQDPWAIELKSRDGVLLGICERRGNRLQLSLNDESQGRPRDFDKTNNAMLLVLTRFPVRSLFVMNADGSGLRRVLTMTANTFIGLPHWSHDGRTIAFASSKSIYGEGTSDAHVWTVGADGSGRKDLGPGAMPSWSRDDKQLAFLSYRPERGVCVMDADGSNRRCLAPQGWGPQWSPQRNEIAYAMHHGGRADLAVYDVDKRQERLLLDKHYRTISWGLTWSPDGAWIGFRGTRLDGTSEFAAVSGAGEKNGFKVLMPSAALEALQTAGSSLAWGGGGKQLLFTGRPKGSNLERMYVVGLGDGTRPRLFPGVPEQWHVGDLAWSADGKQIAFSAIAAEKAKPYLLTAASSLPQDTNVDEQVNLFLLIDAAAVTKRGQIDSDSQTWHAIHAKLQQAAQHADHKLKLHARFHFAGGSDLRELATVLAERFEQLASDLEIEVVCIDNMFRNNDEWWQTNVGAP
jgi:TolB protein